MRAAVAVAVVALWSGLALAAPPAPAPDPNSIPAIEQAVASIRGLAFKRPVPTERMSVAQARALLAKELDAQLPEAEAAVRVRMLAQLKLLPDDYPLRAKLLDLLTEQVAGLYVPERRELVVVDVPPDKLAAMAGGMNPGDMFPVVLAHELDHALDDQYFDLQRLVEDRALRRRDDVQVARQALAEGDATLVMLLFAFRRMGLDPRPDSFPSGETLRSMMKSGGASPGMPQLENAPAYLRSQLVEPYLLGLDLVVSAWKRGGFKAVDEEWRRPPDSTEQLLHADKRHEPPREVAVDRVPDGWTVVSTMELGELGVRSWLATALDEGDAARGAAGWAGDRLALLERAGRTAKRESAVLFASVWDATQDAERFSAAVERWLRATTTADDEWRIDQTGRRIEVFLHRAPPRDPWDFPPVAIGPKGKKP